MHSRASRSSFRVVKWFIAAALVLAVLAAAVIIYLNRFSPIDRAWVVNALEDRYNCDVDLQEFNAALFPQLDVTGTGLTLKPKGEPDLPPLASIKRFSISGNWRDLLRRPRHFREVRLEGLVLNIPPHRAEQRKKKAKVTPFVLDDVVADGTLLNILSSNPDKLPLDFEIRKLRLHSAGLRQAMSFQAVLTNPRPVGDIQTNGKFGPWVSEEPALTPVSGRYDFEHADLGTIRGIAGILSSKGSYQGVLGQIKVEGETDTPDFSLGIGGHPAHLKTQFSAVVDGRNGNTTLDSVDAEIAQSKIHARGSVARTKNEKRRTIVLDASAAPARLEDLLRLAVKSSTPPMMGGVNVRTRIRILPGEQDMMQRLELDGGFAIRTARFTNLNVEEKVASLSRRGQGEPSGSDSGETAFNMRGYFALRRGLMTFSSISFDVPGASVQLHGKYNLLGETLDFQGTLRLQAKLSQTTTGVKSFLLKAVDPIFERKGEGALLPIKVTGTRDQPKFGIELGKALRRSE